MTPRAANKPGPLARSGGSGGASELHQADQRLADLASIFLVRSSLNRRAHGARSYDNPVSMPNIYSHGSAAREIHLPRPQLRLAFLNFKGVKRLVTRRSSMPIRVRGNGVTPPAPPGIRPTRRLRVIAAELARRTALRQVIDLRWNGLHTILLRSQARRAGGIDQAPPATASYHLGTPAPGGLQHLACDPPAAGGRDGVSADICKRAWPQARLTRPGPGSRTTLTRQAGAQAPDGHPALNMLTT